MATNENLIPIPGRLHSVATEGHVAGADEIYDDTLQKDQATINQEVNEAIGTGGSVDSRIAAAKAEIIGGASTDYNTLGKVEDKLENIEGNIAYIDDSESSPAVVPGFDPTTDTVHVTAQTLSESQKAQVRNNIGLGDVDARISNAVASEASRAQAAESNLNSGKADKATTLAGYGITDAYTKSETYTKTEVNGLVDTPHQEYVTVDAYSNLPATGSKDTIYRVSNYNGSTSQVDASVYSEYAWNGSQYVFLCVKSQIGEVFDISVYNNNAKYADLAAALNGGANIPQSLQKGGMSVKFVQSSDNKYVQYRLMADSWSIDTDDWSFCGDDVYVNNPSWIQVVTDNDNKILEGISTDATKITNINTKINNNLSVSGKFGINNAEIETIENSEWVNIVYNEEKRILEGVKKDGTKWLYNLVVGNPLWLTDFVNNILKEKNNFVERKKVYLQESPITVLENSENESLNFASVIKAHTTTHFHCHDNLEISDPNYDELTSAGLGIVPDADVNEEGLWFYNKINRNRRKWYKTNQPTLPVSDYKEINIQTVEDPIYYMYYESMVIQEFIALEDLAVRLCFAYSTDGVNWIKEFPTGVNPPSFHSLDDDPASNQLLPTGEMHGPSVVKVPDSEYPFRMTAVRMDGPNKYFVCIYKSKDGINWEFIRNITTHDCDSPTSCIVRGTTLKIYCRTRTDNSARLRSIGVIYTDLDGNRYYAPDEINHELISIAATSKEHQFYQSSASLLDDRRDILFPTIFNETPIGEPYRLPTESVGCIIVDNDSYKEIVFNDAIINTPEFKQIYFATGLVNTNNRVYAYYTVKTADHDHFEENQKSYIKRVMINVL